jgi:ABC-2 type transport system ATP-binding protein
MMIQTEHLSKTYKNGFQAVKDLNLQVNKGDIFGFLGTNGAGKTTTIRMLDGILQPTAGSVVIDGMDVQNKPLEIKKIIGVVPESHGYYDWMTATEYLQYFDTLFNGKNVNNHYINELLSKVGLEGKRNVLVGHFSRGMKQRLGIAKALINHPKVVFLDEPTLGLDPRGQKDIQQLILDINKMNGVTVFITSHLLKDIEVLCNNVCIIKDGSIADQGSIQQLQKKYMRGFEMILQTLLPIKIYSK